MEVFPAAYHQAGNLSNQDGISRAPSTGGQFQQRGNIFNSVIDYFNHRADGVPFYHYVTMECTWWYFHGILVHRKLCRLTRFSWEWRVKISLSIFMACFMAWTHGVQLMQWNCASIWFSWGVKMLANHSRDLAGEGGGGGGGGCLAIQFGYTITHFRVLNRVVPAKLLLSSPFDHIYSLIYVWKCKLMYRSRFEYSLLGLVLNRGRNDYTSCLTG